MVKKEHEVKEYVKAYKKIDIESLFFAIGLSLIFFGIITGLISAGIYFSGTVFSFPFMCISAGFVILLILFLGVMIPTLVIDDEHRYREKDFDRIDTYYT